MSEATEETARRFARKTDDTRRVLLCDPADVQRVKTALREIGVGHLWVVYKSPLPGPGNCWVVDNELPNAAAGRWQ